MKTGFEQHLEQEMAELIDHVRQSVQSDLLTIEDHIINAGRLAHRFDPDIPTLKGPEWILDGPRFSGPAGPILTSLAFALGKVELAEAVMGDFPKEFGALFEQVLEVAGAKEPEGFRTWARAQAAEMHIAISFCRAILDKPSAVPSELAAVKRSLSDVSSSLVALQLRAEPAEDSAVGSDAKEGSSSTNVL